MKPVVRTKDLQRPRKTTAQKSTVEAQQMKGDATKSVPAVPEVTPEEREKARLAAQEKEVAAGRIMEYLQLNAWVGNLVVYKVFYSERFGDDHAVYAAINYLEGRGQIRCEMIGIALTMPVPRPEQAVLRQAAANGGLISYT